MSAARRRKKAARGRETTWQRRLTKRLIRTGRITREQADYTRFFFLDGVEFHMGWDPLPIRRENDLGCRP